jgi:hypothetical protein
MAVLAGIALPTWEGLLHDPEPVTFDSEPLRRMILEMRSTQAALIFASRRSHRL